MFLYMSHCNCKTIYPYLFKLNTVVSYDGQAVYILLGENYINTFRVAGLCN